MKKKELKRVVLLGMAMSMAVWIPGMAKEITFKDFVGTTEKGGTITVTEDTTVNSRYAGTSSYLEPKERVGDYDIELSRDSTLTLHNLNTYNVNITGEDGGYGGDVVINVDRPYSQGGSYSGGLIVGSAENDSTYIRANNLTINNTISGDNTTRDGIYVGAYQKGDMNIDLTGKLSITAGYYGIFAEGNTNSKITIKANEAEVKAGAWGIILNGSSSINMTTVGNLAVYGSYGISNNSTEVFQFESESGDVNIHAGSLYSIAAGTGNVNVKGQNNQLTVTENSSNTGYVIFSTNGQVKVESTVGNNTLTGGEKTTGIYSRTNSDAGVELIAKQDNIIKAALDGAYSTAGKISLTAVNNRVSAGRDSLKADGQNSAVTEEAEKVNQVEAGEVETVDYDGQKVTFGDSHAAYAVNSGDIYMKAGEANALAGAVYANGSGSEIVMSGLNGAADKVSNFVYSNAKIDGAGDLDEDTSGKFDKDTKVISSLYAEEGATITADGELNVFRTYADDPTDSKTLERTIWAYDRADITVTGGTVISTDRYDETSAAQKGNSADIAIAAGTAVGLDEGTVNTPVADRTVVTVNYDDYTLDDQTYQSSITGDILAAYAGTVNISAQENSGAGINVKGNILAGNNGVLNLDLGNGGTLTGRADDYGDAGVIDGSGHGTSFFDPAFSSSILKGGVVNLKMGDNSRWNVTGQSWITSIDTTGSSNALIDLIEANTDRNSTAHALTVYDMKGDATFNMSLDANRSMSDMLYMKKADGSYLINVYEPVTVEDMYADGFNGLRFATVGKGSNVTFRAITYGQGMKNLEYEVGTDAYDGNDENDAYNSTDGSGTGNEQKPGTGLVDGFFTSSGVPGSTTENAGTETDSRTAANSIMTLADTNETAPAAGTETGTAAGNESTAAEDNASGATNYKLIAVKNEELSNAGNTIIAMSKVNYSNAVYMDRLNKRMGEARHIDGDDGLWVRLRHDCIGRDDAFRSMNTMFELGYDWHAKGQKDGEHRQGVAFDYMRGTADYKNVAGDGDVRRAGVWLYDTWLGDKGHYSDYVVKYGRLSNDFDIYGELGNKIDGDYDNDVWSVSAEYGRKKDIGDDWYFEPQVQAQYAYVTSADYTTSQGTKVSLDSIDSLIGRAGFRLGRDTDEANTVYFKADILHEFLGGQSIRAMDSTGTLSTTYENEGTWYDVGFGFSHRMSKDKYMFLDVEKLFGNDNEDTYQVNIGLNMAF